MVGVLEKPEMRHALLLTMLSVMLLLMGCPKRDAVKEAPPAATQEGGATTPGLETNGVGQGTATGAGAAGEQAGINVRIIYFDFDNADIRPEYRDTIAAHARRLSGTTQRIRLEGHTDERGSREYNIGLGERRAQAVRRALMLLGVSDPQIATVSYGEERPAVQGSDEEAWAKNRRVEIVYIQ
jgi:peptidoglycan-associated lipoprotein